MTQKTKSFIVWAALGSVIGGCRPEQVRTMPNVERAATQWPAGSSPSGGPHICLEYASPAEKLHDREASLKIPIGEKSAEATYADTESLAKIYSVSEIMQFGHAALYRLCEASGNQILDRDQYRVLFNDTLQAVNGLIELQLVRQKLDAIGRLQMMRDELEQIDSERCAKSQLDTASAAQRLLTLHTERKKLVERILTLARESKVPDRIEENRDTPDKPRWDMLRDHLKCQGSPNTDACTKAKPADRCEFLHNFYTNYSFCETPGDQYEEECGSAK